MAVYLKRIVQMRNVQKICSPQAEWQLRLARHNSGWDNIKMEEFDVVCTVHYIAMC